MQGTHQVTLKGARLAFLGSYPRYQIHGATQLSQHASRVISQPVHQRHGRHPFPSAPRPQQHGITQMHHFQSPYHRRDRSLRTRYGRLQQRDEVHIRLALLLTKLILRSIFRAARALLIQVIPLHQEDPQRRRPAQTTRLRPIRNLTQTGQTRSQIRRQLYARLRSIHLRRGQHSFERMDNNLHGIAAMRLDNDGTPANLTGCRK